MRVYKFYSKRWGLEALYRRRLKIATLQDLNDPFEFGAVSKRDKRDRKNLEDFKKAMFTDKGLICFSRNWRNPVIWSHYSDSHKGLALGLDINDEIAMNVKYVKRRLEIPDELRTGAKKIQELDLGRDILSTKFHHWSYEDEVRVFLSLSDDRFENGLYFKLFGDQIILKEIVFGANYESGNNKRLQNELINEGIKFTSSRLAFDSFEVVYQKNKTMWKTL